MSGKAQILALIEVPYEIQANHLSLTCTVCIFQSSWIQDAKWQPYLLLGILAIKPVWFDWNISCALTSGCTVLCVLMLRDFLEFSCSGWWSTCIKLWQRTENFWYLGCWTYRMLKKMRLLITQWHALRGIKKEKMQKDLWKSWKFKMWVNQTHRSRVLRAGFSASRGQLGHP